MKQNLLNKLWLRVCMIVAIMTTALAASADVKTINAGALTNGVLTDSPFTLTFAKNNGSTEPTYNSNGDVRLYAKGTVTVASAGGNMTKIVFNLSAQGKKRLAPITASVGTIATQSSGDETVTWTGDAASVTFTVGDKADYGSDGSSKAGQLCFSSVDITYTAGGTPTVATPVINGTENFLTSTEVSISCATDGATILYNTGGEAWETYSAPFTVTETTTVKAKATKTSMDDSEVATKTFTKVTALTVAEARAAIDAGTGTQGVYATGIVSAIPTAWSTTYNNITFNFVDNSGDEDFLQAFRCVSGTGVDASTVAVGDVVVVYGNLTKYGTTYEFAANCQLVSLTHPTAAVEAPIFTPDGGVFTTPQSVSFAVAAPTMEGYTFYYTLDGTEPTTQSTLYTGPIEVSTTTTIKAIAVKGGEVSLVTTATYAILAHAGTEADPYSVADAHAAIDANAGLTDVYATGVVTEIATAWSTEHSNISFNFVDAAGDGGSFLQAYRCVSTDAADASTVAVGDIVVVKGTLKKYNDIYEFNSGCQLVSLTHSGIPADPVIVAENATIDADVTYYELMYEIQNPIDGTELTASTTASWITSCTPSQKSFDRVMIECEANNETTARTATIVLTYGNVTKEVTLTQEAYVAPVSEFATLPFSFDGGKADIETTAGLTQEGLDSDYGSSPKLKFNGTGDYVVLAFDERPGKLTFDVKGNPSSGVWAGTFTVQTSEDGTTYTDLAAYTDLTSTMQSEEFNNLGENVRYIKWIYTEKVSGNVALGNIALATYTEPVVVASITVDPATVDATAAETTGALELTYANFTVSGAGDFDVQFYDGEGNELQDAPAWIDAEVEANGEGYVVSYVTDANDGEARTTYFKVHAQDNENKVVYSNLVTVSQAAYVAPATGDQYALFTGSLEEGDYIIYYDGYAMNTDVESGRLMYAEVTPESDVITTSNAAIVWHIAKSGDYWTLYNAEADAYAAGTGVKNKAQMLADGTDDMALWTVSGTDTYEFVNKANAAASVNANLRKNGTYGFACYATTTGGALSLYKKVPATGVQTITVTDAGYATMVAAADLEIPSGVEVYAVQVNSNYAHLESVTTGVPAGEAVVVKADAGDYNFAYAASSVPAITGNNLQAATTDVTADGTQYVLANGASGIGFYQATSGSTIPAGKAYLVVTAAGVKPFYGFEDDATGIEMVNGQSSMVNDPIFNLAGQRLQKMQRGINIIGGKKILK